MGVISYSNGWLEQGSDESYRWISGSGIITIESDYHRRVKIEGYIPSDFDEVTEVRIWINNELMEKIDVSNRGSFSGDYSEIHNNDGQIEIEIAFNDVHKPDEGSGEVRELSGFISKIQLE